MPEDKSSKTEAPTPRRLSQARQKGQVAKSMEVNTCAVLMAALFTMLFSASYMYEMISQMMAGSLSTVAQTSIEGADLFSFFIQKVKYMALIMAPILVIVPAIGLLSNFLQVGALFTVEPLQPKLSKLNPISGFSKLFSARSFVELFKSIFKISIIATVAYQTIKSDFDTIIVLGDMTPAQIGHFTMSLSFEIFLKTIWALTVMAAIDYAFQKWQHMRDMKMTKQEVKEDMKQTEGDPKVKSRIRSIQREMARKRMMAAVPEADVVVTNPTHLAIALLYQAEKSEAPMVVAKGQGALAERIKEIAKEHDVPIMEDKPLARALYKAVEVDEEIPVLFYQAVAEILSYVYRLKGKTVNG